MEKNSIPWKFFPYYWPFVRGIHGILEYSGLNMRSINYIKPHDTANQLIFKSSWKKKPKKNTFDIFPNQCISNNRSCTFLTHHYYHTKLASIINDMEQLSVNQTSIQDSEELPLNVFTIHDNVIKWKHFPLYWPFVQGIHRSRVNSPHKGQWRGALMFSLICTWINGWVNNH